METETVIWGTKNNAPDHEEQLLYDGGQKLSESNINAIKGTAAAVGFGRFRVKEFSLTAGFTN